MSQKRINKGRRELQSQFFSNILYSSGEKFILPRPSTNFNKRNKKAHFKVLPRLQQNICIFFGTNTTHLIYHYSGYHAAVLPAPDNLQSSQQWIF